MQLIIVESPSKAKTIEKYLGGRIKVDASGGHVRDLPEKRLGVNVADNYEPNYVITADKRSVIKRLQDKCDKSDKIYLATDPDREGEAIAWHLKESLGLDDHQYQRITFDAITEEVVQKALRNERKIDNQLVQAQEARRALDRIFGYLVSPVVSDQLGLNVSAGRVQTPAVRIVVEREAQIKGFKRTNHFGAEVFFAGASWSAEWDTADFVNDDAPYVLDPSLAASAAACRDFEVVDASTKTASKAPPSPFSTSLLLQAASVSLKLDPEVTAKLAQRLFEQGAITYIRTDSVNFSDEAIAELRSYMAGQNLALADSPRKFKSKGGAQEAHEAIRPTHFEVEEAGQDDAQKALYRLIWQRSVASQMADAKYQVNTVNLKATSAEGQAFKFTAKGRVLVSAGWRSLTASDAADEGSEDDEKTSGTVPSLEPQTTLAAESGKVVEKATKAPSRYTKASLIAKLEAEGVGRPSTYPAIMQNIVQKGYLVEEKRFLAPTEIGVLLVSSLVDAGFAFVDLDFTRSMEMGLDEVAEGQCEFLDIVTPAYEQLNADLEAARAKGAGKPRFPCTKCGQAMRRYSAPGKVPFWFCSGSDDCKTYMDDADGKPVPRVTHSCPKCNASQLVKFQKRDKATQKPKGGFGWVCKGCNSFFDDAKGKPVEQRTVACPACGKDMLRRKGSNGYFWGCTGYAQGCRSTLDDKNGKPVKRDSQK